MATKGSPCSTHTYDGKLRKKWLQMRPMLMDNYFPQCLSFDETITEIEKWLNEKYYNVKRIGRARRSINILIAQRRGNLDSRNDIDVEELLPMVWRKIKEQEDLHDLFYEQFCDITGGSCAQGRSTRLFQFLFLFDSMFPTNEANSSVESSEESVDQSRPAATTTTTSNDQIESEEKPSESVDVSNEVQT